MGHGKNELIKSLVPTRLRLTLALSSAKLFILIRSFVRSFICLFIRSFVCSFARSFARSLVCSLIRSLVCLLVGSTRTLPDPTRPDTTQPVPTNPPA